MDNHEAFIIFTLICYAYIIAKNCFFPLLHLKTVAWQLMYALLKICSKLSSHANFFKDNDNLTIFLSISDFITTMIKSNYSYVNIFGMNGQTIEHFAPNAKQSKCGNTLKKEGEAIGR